MTQKKYFVMETMFPQGVLELNFVLEVNYLNPRDRDLLITGEFYDKEGVKLPFEDVSASYSSALDANYRDLDQKGGGEGVFSTLPFKFSREVYSLKVKIYEWKKPFSNEKSLRDAVMNVWAVSKGKSILSNAINRLGDARDE